MLNTLVDRQDREVAASGQASSPVYRAQTRQHPRGTVAVGDDPIDKVRPRDVELAAANARAFVPEEIVSLFSE
jgi:hypothetical protein